MCLLLLSCIQSFVCICLDLCSACTPYMYFDLGVTLLRCVHWLCASLPTNIFLPTHCFSLSAITYMCCCVWAAVVCAVRYLLYALSLLGSVWTYFCLAVVHCGPFTTVGVDGLPMCEVLWSVCAVWVLDPALCAFSP